MGISPNGKKYIGQHKGLDFTKRYKTHEYNYIQFLKKRVLFEFSSKYEPTRIIPITGTCTALYSAFVKYGGINSFQWIIVHQNVPYEQLSKIEDQLMLEHNTLSPNGYNLKLNAKYENMSSFSYETREKMRISSKKKVKDNLHKYRKKHDMLIDVPQHVTYFDSGGIRGYRIVNHPNCKFKQFADGTSPIEDLKHQLLDFLDKCKITPYKTVQQQKSMTDVPKGISEQKPGKFVVQFAYKGIRYTKCFTSSNRSVSLAKAIMWMNNKKKELIQVIPNIKEEGSETK